jgi:hypothetical protein
MSLEMEMANPAVDVTTTKEEAVEVAVATAGKEYVVP